MQKTELESREFDHAPMCYTLSYHLLTLGWTDENAFLPVNDTLLAFPKDSNLVGPQKKYYGQSLSAQRRKLAQMKETDTKVELLKGA